MNKIRLCQISVSDVASLKKYLDCLISGHNRNLLLSLEIFLPGVNQHKISLHTIFQQMSNVRVKSLLKMSDDYLQLSTNFTEPFLYFWHSILRFQSIQ